MDEQSEYNSITSTSKASRTLRHAGVRNLPERILMKQRSVLRTEILQIYSNLTNMFANGLIAEYNKKYEFFRDIAGVAMKVHL